MLRESALAGAANDWVVRGAFAHSDEDCGCAGAGCGGGGCGCGGGCGGRIHKPGEDVSSLAHGGTISIASLRERWDRLRVSRTTSEDGSNRTNWQEPFASFAAPFWEENLCHNSLDRLVYSLIGEMVCQDACAEAGGDDPEFYWTEVDGKCLPKCKCWFDPFIVPGGPRDFNPFDPFDTYEGGAIYDYENKK